MVPVVASEPETKIVVVMVFTHRYSSFSRMGHEFCSMQLLPSLQHLAGYVPSGSV